MNIDAFLSFKPGLHEPQMPVERSIMVVSSIVVKLCCCMLPSQQRRSTTRKQRNKTLHFSCSFSLCKPGFNLLLLQAEISGNKMN